MAIKSPAQKKVIKKAVPRTDDKPITCEVCNGFGRTSPTESCGACKGTGKTL